MKVLKCIVIDDEPLALRLMETFIAQTPFAELLATCDNAIEGMELLRKTDADLVFLDINMPKFNGMELARWMQQQSFKLPYIIFTTAYNHYAIEGYKVNAVDYLLKPFGYEEFLRAMGKVLQMIEKEVVVSTAKKDEDVLFVKVEYQWVKVYYDDILYIEGLKDYVRFYLRSQEKTLLSLTSLKVLEEKLPSSMFLRVHRSVIVALKSISSITKNSLFIDEKEISIGDQYKEAFKTIVDRWLL
ncbi:LytR/AlgR family response regulator transcription factor [Sphingobacterium sp. LRF_L2]|uniref:LytR/AlgR family response regulator transcription factor n=1 Tax=Sphingobacterium sp. LRF_L2 TaxID=3369421 RepID=UPI003F62AD71